MKCKVTYVMASMLLTASALWGQDDPIKTLVGRLDLERYKATIKALTKFGDRREGTDRNRAAVDWIETQLKSYGCANTERLHYEIRPQSSPAPPPPLPAFPGPMGGGVFKGQRGRVTGAPNNDPDAQPDARLRQLNMQPSTPGPRDEVFCTKIGTTHPEEMYIVGAHMDGKGLGRRGERRRVWNSAGDGGRADS